ncbi:AraC family transcriptional regulator [Oryzifoliimicrobium ureilyticus]|uniref:AraC family transcriptional regulator n=1 Tax=Oryzifoliimicrobium ureilyticus TaxID=3113724 RepID=UPI003075FF69
MLAADKAKVVRKGGSGFSLRAGLIPGVEIVEADTGFSFGRHMHDQFGLGLIRRGAQRSLSGRGMVEAGAGDIITVNPGEVHDGAPIGDDGRAWSILYFDPDILSRFYADMTEGAHTDYEFTRPVFVARAAAASFHRLFQAISGNDALKLEESIFLMLATLRENPATARHKKLLLPMSSAIAAAKARIDDNPALPVALEELAALAGLSRFQLLRSFARATGLTPHAYLIQRRLHLARRLILKGEALAEVAFAAGFFDQSHLNRLFLRSFGMTPGQCAAHFRQTAH